jgi:transcriptional regulator with XRE-family HTH domain
MPSLAQIRRARGVTQSEVAEALGVAQPTVSYWERGVIPQDIHAAAIMEYFKLTPTEYHAAMTSDTLAQARAIGKLLRKAKAGEAHRLSDDEHEQLAEVTEERRAAAVEAGWLPADAAPVDPIAFPGWYVGPPKTSPED